MPSDLTDTNKAIIFEILDANLNSMILGAQLHGEQSHFMSLYVCADQ